MRTILVSLVFLALSARPARTIPPRATDLRVAYSERLAVAWFGSIVSFQHGSADAQNLMRLFAAALPGLAHLEPLAAREACLDQAVLYFETLGLDRSDPIVCAAERSVLYAIDGSGDLDRILVGMSTLPYRAARVADPGLQSRDEQWLLDALRRYVQP
jgi:hypothetical protein